jgi:hypothetical protein
MDASFSPGTIPSGGTTELIVTYTCDQNETLHLNWDAHEFDISPASFALPASPAGRTTPPPSLRVTITRLTANPSCGVHVVLGDLAIDGATCFAEVT